MVQKILLVITVIVLIIISSCSNNSVEPELQPGRRDYVWTADTIKAYYVYFNSLWGKTVNDVWMVSAVGSVFENIYRYDGTKWYRETRTPIGNTVSLWGTENNLWISTKDGRIWNYKNDAFFSSQQFLYEGKEIDFFSIAGKNDNEVYAGGGPRNFMYRKPTVLYKYDGNNWLMSKIIKNGGTITSVSSIM